MKRTITITFETTERFNPGTNWFRSAIEGRIADSKGTVESWKIADEAKLEVNE